MRYTDIAIVGGGLAGSTAAAMLGRAGIPTILIDPHPVYPPDLRCEKPTETRLISCARPDLRKPCCGQPRMMAGSGSRASATCSTRSPATSTASLYDTS